MNVTVPIPDRLDSPPLPLTPHGVSASLEAERLAWLAFVPVLVTGLFYALPNALQGHRTVQFLPQFMAYLCLAGWASRNPAALARLGLKRNVLRPGVLWGGATGVLLGCINTAVILWVVPGLGLDIEFLRYTPHAKIPPVLMLPWMILSIAILVELNFRGFLLGRLLAVGQRRPLGRFAGIGPPLAVVTSAVVFAFDPFMVATFQYLHWIAVWDGIIWGILWVRLRNLSATIVAHAVEVMILYTVLKAAL